MTSLRVASILTFAVAAFGWTSAAQAGDPEVKNVTPTGANTVIGGGKTTVTANIVRFPANTLINVTVRIRNKTTDSDTGGITVFQKTTDANGEISFSEDCGTPAGSTGDNATVTVEAHNGATDVSASSTTATFK